MPIVENERPLEALLVRVWVELLREINTPTLSDAEFESRANELLREINAELVEAMRSCEREVA